MLVYRFLPHYPGDSCLTPQESFLSPELIQVIQCGQSSAAAPVSFCANHSKGSCPRFLPPLPAEHPHSSGWRGGTPEEQTRLLQHLFPHLPCHAKAILTPDSFTNRFSSHSGQGASWPPETLGLQPYSLSLHLHCPMVSLLTSTPVLGFGASLTYSYSC